MKHFSMTANFTDYPDSSKMCVSVHFAGCEFNCPECHNPDLQDPDYAPESWTPYDTCLTVIDNIVDYCKRNRTNNVALMGGDPLHSSNIENSAIISSALIHMGFNVLLYTGYSFKSILRNTPERFRLPKFTLLKTGIYSKDTSQVSGLTDDTFTLSSTNQEMYDSDLNLLSEDGIYKYI